MNDQNLSIDWAAKLIGSQNPLQQKILPATQEAFTPNTEQGNFKGYGSTSKQGSSPLSPNRSSFSPSVSSSRLTVFADKLHGKVFDLALHSMQLGRASSNDIVIQDPCISARHCIFEVRDDGVWVRDLGSANGTFLNGQGISESLLRCGDVIRCGTSILKYEITLKRPRLDPPQALNQQSTHKAPDSRPTSRPAPQELDEGPISFDKISVRQKNTSPKKGGSSALIASLALAIVLVLLVAGIYYFFPSLVPWLSR